MARALRVEILGDEQSVLRSFKNASRGAKGFERDLGRSARGAVAASVSFRGLGRSLSFASAQFLGGAGIVYALKAVIGETSRVQEETEKTSVVFGRNAQQVQDWSKTLAQSFGVSEGAALEATGRFGNMLRPLKFGTDAAAKMSERLVELAADMASFNNAKPADVLQALSSGLAGQVRPLRQYGVFLSQDRIKQEALTDGIVKNASHLTQAQKVQAAYNIILKDTVNAQGDVHRNTGSLSVAMSKLTAGIQDTEAGLGAALLPTVTQYVNKAAAWLNSTENQQRIQKDFNEAIRVASHVIDGATSSIKAVTHAVGGFKNLIELLLAFKLTGWALGIGRSFGLIGTQATVANGEVVALRASLLSISGMAIAPIVIPLIVDEVVHGKKGLLSRAATAGSKAVAGAVGVKTSDNGQGPTYQQYVKAAKHHDANFKNIQGYMKRAGITDPRNLPGGPLAGGSANPGSGQHHTTQGRPFQHTSAPTTTTPGSGGGSGGGSLDRRSQIENAAQQARTAMASGDKGAKAKLVAALKQQIDFDKKYAAIQGKLADKGGKDAKKHSDTMRQLLADEASAYAEIGSLNDKSAAAAKTAAKKTTKKKAAVKAVEFVLPFKLQLGELEAQTTKTTGDDQRIAKAEKAFAMKMIKSGKLRGQALLDAWQEIVDANSRIADTSHGTALKHYHFASLASLTKGIKDESVRKDVEARIAQAQAHSGAIYVKELHVKANNPDQLAEGLKRKAKKGTAQRRGHRAGQYMGLH